MYESFEGSVFRRRNLCVCLGCRRADEAAAKQVKGTEKEVECKRINDKGGPETHP